MSGSTRATSTPGATGTQATASASAGQPPVRRVRLITIPLSHFCEKARWALDRAAIPYREEGHVPLVQIAYAKWAGGKRTVPVLVDGRTAINDSTDILAWADARLPPERRLHPEDPALAAESRALEDLFDERLGPHSRRLAYHHLLPDRRLSLDLIRHGTPFIERAGMALVFPLGRFLLRRLLRIDPAAAERSLARVREVFGEVTARLADGRPWLLGKRFGAADLTFAALAAPVLLPAEHAKQRIPLERVPPEFRAVIEDLRATPAGALGLRAYAEERSRVVGVQ